MNAAGFDFAEMEEKIGERDIRARREMPYDGMKLLVGNVSER